MNTQETHKEIHRLRETSAYCRDEARAVCFHQRKALLEQGEAFEARARALIDTLDLKERRLYFPPKGCPAVH